MANKKKNGKSTTVEKLALVTAILTVLGNLIALATKIIELLCR